MQVREISMIAEIFTREENLRQMDDLAKAKNPADTKVVPAGNATFSDCSSLAQRRTLEVSSGAIACSTLELALLLGQLRRSWLRRQHRAILAHDRVVDFLPVNRHIFWGLDTEAHLVTANINDGDNDVVVEDDGLIDLPRQNEHVTLLVEISKVRVQADQGTNVV